MNFTDKNKYKSEFKRDLDKFCTQLEKYTSTENGDWTIKGFIDIYKNIYTISADTKIVSKILEIHIFPQILQFADSAGYNIIIAEKQNWYPDLTFVYKKNDTVKFALDIKTTYRRNSETTGFTLGSHGGYFKEREKDKNIQFPYSQYLGHYCLGVIYTRVDFPDKIADTEIYQVEQLQEDGDKKHKPVNQREVTTVKNLKSITSVIKDFDFFAAEKWKIASDKSGSGNTANIGSVFSVSDLKSENGVFSKLGEKWFDEYWINYGSATMMKEGKTIKITNLRDFLEFKGRSDLWEKIVTKTKTQKKKITKITKRKK